MELVLIIIVILILNFILIFIKKLKSKDCNRRSNQTYLYFDYYSVNRFDEFRYITPEEVYWKNKSREIYVNT